MQSYSLKHLKDQPLLDGLDDSFVRCYANAATRLAHVAEVDARQLYRQAGYPSMTAYCMGRFRVSKDSAYKLVRAAQLAYEYPVLFEAVADGRLQTRGIVLLGPRLTPKTVDELLAMATHKTCEEIVLLLAERYPRPDLAASIRRVAPETAAPAVDLSPVVPTESRFPVLGEVPLRSSSVTPRSPGRYLVQVMFDEDMHADMEEIRNLSVDSAPPDLQEIIRRAMKDHLAKLRKQRFAATSRPGHSRGSRDPRHIPAHVKRAVRERDAGQCTFVSDSGHRCEARRHLQHDHVLEVSRGGDASFGNIRLRCHAHNQLAAEQTFGADFMRSKRLAAQEAREAERAARLSRAEAERDARRLTAESERAARQAGRARVEAEKTRAREADELEQDPDRSVVPWLRAMGLPLADARAAASAVENMTDARMEERVKAAFAAYGRARFGNPRKPFPNRDVAEKTAKHEHCRGEVQAASSRR